MKKLTFILLSLLFLVPVLSISDDKNIDRKVEEAKLKVLEDIRNETDCIKHTTEKGRIFKGLDVDYVKFQRYTSQRLKKGIDEEYKYKPAFNSKGETAGATLTDIEYNTFTLGE